MRTVAILFTIILFSCSSTPETPKEAPTIPVNVASLVIRDVPVYLESIGTLHPSVFMEIRPQVDGTLAEVLIKEGEWVEKGSPLFKIDPKPYQIKVQEAKAQLGIDRAEHEAALKKLERFRDLAQKEIIAKTQWDDLEAHAAKAQVVLDLDQARLDAALLELDRCTLVSPVEGRVGKLDAHPGLLVSRHKATPLVTISKMDPLTVEFTVTEKEYPLIPQKDLTIEMASLCSTQECATGSVTFLDNQFDPKTGLLLVRGSVSNPEHTLRPGQSMRVSIPIAVSANAKLIPQKAIRYSQDGPYVYVVQPDMTVAIRPLILGEEQGSEQIVLEGIDSSEQLILDGHLRVSPGSKIEIKS